jgi:hypothetical protein
MNLQNMVDDIERIKLRVDNIEEGFSKHNTWLMECNELFKEKHDHQRKLDGALKEMFDKVAHNFNVIESVIKKLEEKCS